MENEKKRIVIALSGSTPSNTLPEQMIAVRTTAKAVVDLIEEGCEVTVAHGNGPQVGVINNAMVVLSRRSANWPNTPFSVCVTMSQVYIGYDLQDALREELYNHEMYDIPVATMITRVCVGAEDPTFDTPNKPVGHFMTRGQAKIIFEKYGHIMKGDAGCGYRRVVASPKPAKTVETGAIRSLVGSDQLVIAYDGGGTPVTRRGNHLKDASTVIGKGLASELLAEGLNADSLIILTVMEKVAINFGKPEEKWLNNLTSDQAHVYMEEGHFVPGFILPKVQAAVEFTGSKDGRTTLITLLKKAKEEVQGLAGIHIHQQS